MYTIEVSVNNIHKISLKSLCFSLHSLFLLFFQSTQIRQTNPTAELVVTFLHLLVLLFIYLFNDYI